MPSENMVNAYLTIYYEKSQARKIAEKALGGKNLVSISQWDLYFITPKLDHVAGPMPVIVKVIPWPSCIFFCIEKVSPLRLTIYWHN